VGAFAGKRCINPASRILTLDGPKAFADVSSQDHVLSFDQTAKRFRISQSGCAFPKTKSTGFRVVHDRGEFVVSGHHRLLASSGRYLSVLEIFEQRRLGANVQAQSLLCPSQTTEELALLLYSSGARRCSETSAGSQERCETYSHQYGQRPHSAQGIGPALFPSQYGAQRYYRQGASPGLYECRDDRLRTVGARSHHGPSCVQTATLGVQAHAAFPFCSGDIRQGPSVTFAQYPRDSRWLWQQAQVGHGGHTQLSQTQGHILGVSASASHILAIEEVQEQWFWDIEVPGDNNYLCDGAVHHNSGKTEGGVVRDIRIHEERPGWTYNGRDNLQGVIMAPTHDMLMRVTWKKFMSFARGFIKESTIQPLKATWHDGTEVIGISADRPERLEGIKPFWIHLDECFQMKEQVFLEAMARVADQRGYVTCTGSLGTQYVHPRQHWAHKHFKEKPGPNTECFEWRTLDNPHFPKEELEQLKHTLDAESFKQMFELNWDSNSSNMVYADFSSDNLVKGYKVNPNLPILIAIDWGWRHKMACLFAQYDQSTDTVIVFDEIVESKLTLEGLLAKIRARNLPISAWCCDIAGNQEREMVGISNVQQFKKWGVTLQFRKTAVLYGVALVRSYVKTAAGRVRLIIAEDKCPQTVDAIKRYRYPEKDGISAAEVPVKEDDDAVDALRYLFVNFIDKDIRNRSSKTIKL